MVMLDEVLEGIGLGDMHGTAAIGGSITGVTSDSREVEPGAMFFAVRGFMADGHRYIDAAIRAGASVVVCEELPEPCLPDLLYVRVPDTRQALAEASRIFYGNASDRLMIIGVTGTNGKTTTSRMIAGMLDDAGIPAGFIGTGLCRIGGREIVIERTTPEAPQLHALFRQMVDAGCRAVVMEVSSHALMLRRVHGLRFRVALFTNLTPEHLDFHETMSRYAEAKQLLFGQLTPDGVAVINADDPTAAFMTENLPRERVYCCTLGGTLLPCAPERLFEASLSSMSVDGSQAAVKYQDHAAQVSVGIPGSYNVMNMLEAFATGICLGIDRQVVATVLSGSFQVEGRMEKVWSADRLRCAVVDYAHTPDALRKALEALRRLTPQGARLVVVFGCGGNRDRLKRPEMGRIASELADMTFLTSDNPRDEDPEAIMDDIERGMEGENHVKIVDRREAIRAAVSTLHCGDILLVAGKGHEKYQETAGKRHYFSDQAVLRECFGRGMAVGAMSNERMEDI